MRDLVQIEVYKEYNGPGVLLYNFLVDLSDGNWTYDGMTTVEETLKRHGKGYFALAQDFKDVGDDGLIDCNKTYSVIDFYDLQDSI